MSFCFLVVGREAGEKTRVKERASKVLSLIESGILFLMKHLVLDEGEVVVLIGEMFV
jgi:hypothetical protein